MGNNESKSESGTQDHERLGIVKVNEAQDTETN